MLNFELQKHFEELFPPTPEPSAEILAQAALFVVLRDQPISTLSGPASLWISLASKRFAGDVYGRTITLQKGDTTREPTTVHVKSLGNGHFDITVHTPSADSHFASVCGHLLTPTTLSATLNDTALRTTIVSQPPPATVPASTAPNTQQHMYTGPIDDDNAFSQSEAPTCRSRVPELPQREGSRSIGA